MFHYLQKNVMVERHWDSFSGRLWRIWATSEAVALTWANVFSGVWHWELLHFPVRKVPWLWERAGNTQPRFVQREKQVVGEWERGRVCVRAEEFLLGAGRGVSEVVTDPGWQESFNKRRSVGSCVFSSAFTLTWARGPAMQNSTFRQNQYFFSKATTIAGCLACVRWIATLLTAAVEG